MIEAQKNRLLESWMSAANTRMLKRHFHALHAGGLEQLSALDRSLPIIITPNHSNWWDGLIAFFLSRRVLHLDSYLMMEERQMVRYRFFRWIGAFSVIRENPREAVKSLRYAAALLDRPNRAVWIYPQGTMLPNATRPLVLSHGAGRLARILGDVQILPVAHAYEFRQEQRPEVFTLFGHPLRVTRPKDHRDVTAQLQRVLTELHDDLRCSITRGEVGQFHTILRGQTSTDRLFDRIRGIRQ